MPTHLQALQGMDRMNAGGGTGTGTLRPQPQPQPQLPPHLTLSAVPVPAPSAAALCFWDDDERGPARALPPVSYTDDDAYLYSGKGNRNLFKEILESIDAMGRERMWDEVAYCHDPLPPCSPNSGGDQGSIEEDGWSDDVSPDVETGMTGAQSAISAGPESTVPPDSLLYPAISKFAYT